MEEMDEYESFDVNAAVSNIASDLFGAGEPEGGSSNSSESASPPPDAGTAIEAAPSLASPAPNSTETPESIDPLPKSWKKEMEGDWKTLPKTVRDYVYKRESDVLAGIQQYHSGHQSYNAITEPFKEIFSQHPDVQPVQLFQNLMHSHVKLLTLPPEQKQAFGRELLTAYGITLDGEQPAPAALPPGYSQMQQELAETRRILRENQERAHQAEIARYDEEVKAFAKKNSELFPLVQNDILRLISTGAANDLQSAYDSAIWTNPATREKLLAKQQADALEAANKATTKPRPTNVESSGSARVNGARSKSIDQTIEETASRLFAKH